MSSSLRSVIAITALSVAILQPFGRASAAEQDIECPPNIPAESIRFADSAEGWVGFVPAPLPLSAAGFMQAEPSKQADLKPSSIRKANGSTIVNWVFEGQYPQGKWLSCEYAGGVASLSRRIADTTAECAVVYMKTQKGAAVALKISCK